MVTKINYLRTFAIVLTLLTLIACYKLHYNYRLSAKPPKQLRIATYNVNWGQGEKPNLHPEQTIHAMKVTHADIIILQETTSFWQQKITQAFSKEYPYREFRDNDKAGGFGIISKYPFKTKDYFPPLFGWNSIWIMQVQTPLGKLQLANIHLTPPVIKEGDIGFLANAVFSSMPKRRYEVQFIHSLLNKNLPAIIAGDFNEGEIGSAVKYLRENNFSDAWQNNNIEDHTWEWNWGLFKFYDRFDRFFYTTPLQLTNIQVIHLGDSDHYPVVADFRKR